jgi:hypothetical protein
MRSGASVPAFTHRQEVKMEPQQSHKCAGACVEFTFRVHSDGRQERFATVLIADDEGSLRAGPRQPEGELRRFVAGAVSEAMQELSLRPRRRRRER